MVNAGALPDEQPSQTSLEDDQAFPVINVNRNKEVQIFSSNFKPVGRIEDQGLFDSQDLSNLSELMSHRKESDED